MCAKMCAGEYFIAFRQSLSYIYVWRLLSWSTSGLVSFSKPNKSFQLPLSFFFPCMKYKVYQVIKFIHPEAFQDE